MGNDLSQQRLSISIQPGVNFSKIHKPQKQKSLKSQSSINNKVEMMFPSYLKKINKNGTKLEYNQRCNYKDREYQFYTKKGNHNDENILCIKRQKILNKLSQQQSLVQNQNQSHILWRVIDLYQTVQLKQNNVIKLGETQFVVKKICRNYNELDIYENMKTSQLYQSRNMYNSHMYNSKNQAKMENSRYHEQNHHNHHKIKSIIMQKSNHLKSSELFTSDSQCCRICFSRSDLQKNPLLSLCKCTGSIKHIHYHCLKSWIKHTSKYESYDSFQYIEYNLSCDICKSKIQKVIHHKNKKYIIHGEYMNHPPFVILDQKTSNPSTSSKVRQYIINFDHKHTVMLGRNRNCDVWMNEKHMHDQHCQLVYEGNKLFIRNMNPSSATFINFTSQNVKNSLNLVVDNNLITIMREGESCCYDNKLKIVYQEQSYQ